MIKTNSYKKLFSAVLFSSILLIQSCVKDNDFVDSSSQRYLGKQNTVREYETTTWEYEANTDVPYIKVPDSLILSLSIDSSLISQGVVGQSYRVEQLIQYDTTWHVVSNPTLCAEGLQLKTIIEYYDLNNELQCIYNSNTYSKSLMKSTGGTIYLENDNSFGMFSGNNNNDTILVKPLSIGVNWIRESHQYKNNNGELNLFQQECTVISQEEVEVQAGNFLAYKIEIIDHWASLNIKQTSGYEYYVPNVGLILEEWDKNLYRTTVTQSDSETIYFRQKYRKELVSYNFK